MKKTIIVAALACSACASKNPMTPSVSCTDVIREARIVGGYATFRNTSSEAFEMNLVVYQMNPSINLPYDLSVEQIFWAASSRGQKYTPGLNTIVVDNVPPNFHSILLCGSYKDEHLTAQNYPNYESRILSYDFWRKMDNSF